MRGGPAEAVTEGNLELRPRSNEGFIEALRTARGVVAGGGFSLLSEAVYLGKPILSIPLRGQFEQTMNARYTGAPRLRLVRADPDAGDRRGVHRANPGVRGRACGVRAVRELDHPRRDRGSRARGGRRRPRELRKARRAARRARKMSRGAGAAVGAAVGAAGFAFFHGQYPTSQLYGETICRVPEAERMIALTYDDGPNPRHTEELMSVLDAPRSPRDVPADRQVGRARAGDPAEPGRRRARARQPHLVASDDAASDLAPRSARSCGDVARRSRLPGCRFRRLTAAT